MLDSKHKLASTLIIVIFTLISSCSFKYYKSNIKDSIKEFKFAPNTKKIFFYNALRIGELSADPWTIKEERNKLDKVIETIQNNLAELHVSSVLVKDKEGLKDRDLADSILISCIRKKNQVPYILNSVLNPFITIITLGLIPIYDNTTYTYTFSIRETNEISLRKEGQSSPEFFISITTWEGWIPYAVAKSFADVEYYATEKHVNRIEELNFTNNLTIQLLKLLQNDRK